MFTGTHTFAVDFNPLSTQPKTKYTALMVTTLCLFF